MIEVGQSAHLLVVDDEASTRFSLAEILRLQGYRVSTAASGEEALTVMADNPNIDLILLDIKMSGISGLDVIEVVRRKYPGVIVILLTAFGTLDTAIQALRQGAHDYLLKPCPIAEIVDSVRRGLMRRQQELQRRELVSQLQRALWGLSEEFTSTPTAQEHGAALESRRFLRVRDLTLDCQRYVATLNERPLNLTRTEFQILACLMKTPDHVWTPQELIANVQGYEIDPWSARAIIRVHIRRLRKKIEADPSNPQYILNVRGIGYMLASAPLQA